MTHLQARRASKRRPLRRSALVLVLVCGLGASGVSAQAVPQSQDGGVWYGVTLGGSAARLTCDLCQASRDLGPAVTVAAGAHGASNLRVGLEVSAWTHEQGGVREKMYGLGLVAHLVPDPRRGLYLLGGFGWSGYRAGDLSYDAPRVTVGLGWDVPVFGPWVVGNVVTLDGAAFAGLRNEDQTVIRNVGMSALRVAVQLRKR